MKIPPPDIHTPLPLRDPQRDASLNHYWSYHQLPTLLACKQPLTDSADEDLFIAVHQVCEIAFHQMVLDLQRTLDAWRTALHEPEDGVIDDPAEALYFLQRVQRLWRTVNTTMPVLADMRGFAQFRNSIGPTSGFQSLQFRHVEILSGVRRRYWQGGTADAQFAQFGWVGGAAPHDRGVPAGSGQGRGLAAHRRERSSAGVPEIM
jgi:tryptophan 2,3-dioxygenase